MYLAFSPRRTGACIYLAGELNRPNVRSLSPFEAAPAFLAEMAWVFLRGNIFCKYKREALIQTRFYVINCFFFRFFLSVDSYLSEQTPWMFFRARRREWLLKNMEEVLETVRTASAHDIL